MIPLRLEVTLLLLLINPPPLLLLLLPLQVPGLVSRHKVMELTSVFDLVDGTRSAHEDVALTREASLATVS